VTGYSPQYISATRNFIAMKLTKGGDHFIRVYGAKDGALIGSVQGTVYNMAITTIPVGWRPTYPWMEYSPGAWSSEDDFVGCFAYADTGFSGPVKGWACTAKNGFAPKATLVEDGNNDEQTLLLTPEIVSWRATASNLTLANLKTRSLYKAKKLLIDCLRPLSRTTISVHDKGNIFYIVDFKFTPPKIRHISFARALGPIWHHLLLIPTSN